MYVSGVCYVPLVSYVLRPAEHSFNDLQYFLWYLLFLPLLLSRLSTTPGRGLAYVAVWVGTQVLWLSEAYKLEFLGQNVFFSLWIRGCVYLLGNVWVLAGIMMDYVV